MVLPYGTRNEIFAALAEVRNVIDEDYADWRACVPVGLVIVEQGTQDPEWTHKLHEMGEQAKEKLSPYRLPSIHSGGGYRLTLPPPAWQQLGTAFLAAARDLLHSTGRACTGYETKQLRDDDWWSLRALGYVVMAWHGVDVAEATSRLNGLRHLKHVEPRAEQ